MTRVVKVLFKPAVLALIGVLALSLVVWFQAPYLAFDGAEPFESIVSRSLIIALLLLSWAAYYGWKWFAARRANKLLMQGLAQEAAPADPAQEQSSHEVALLSKRMDNALATLRSSKGNKRFGQQYLYQIPWFMFVGAPGSGKTTALVHSGLKFPLAETMGSASVGGVGGTRNCDWWFTDEAVLLDTAGRYTTQDSDSQVDKAAWSGFLDLLKRHRKRRPINGVIVAISVADLLQQDDTARRAHARIIRERIAELHQRLEISFPIYVMVTKCDLLAGFSEFYEDLGKQGREQVWGVTFDDPAPEKTDACLESLTAELQALEARLNDRTMVRLQQERDLARRSLIYRFAHQFAGLSAVLQPFLIDAFQSSRYEQAPLLRGIYFTSGTQEGSPIDRVLGALSGTFGLANQQHAANASSGRSYFITRLLQDVIFPESGIAGTNLKFERYRTWAGRGALGAAALAVLIGSGLLLNSYLQNKSYVAQVARYSKDLRKVAAEPAARGDAFALVPFLNAVRDIPGGFQSQQDDSGPIFGLGLSQHDKLGSQAVDLYRRALNRTLMPRVVEQLESQLRLGSAANLDYLYEVLRVYLMLGDSQRFDAGPVAALLEYDFEQIAASSGKQPAVKDLRSHLHNLVHIDGVDRTVAIDPGLVKRSRLVLAKLPLDSRIYNRLKRNLTGSGLAQFSAAQAGGADAATVLVRHSGQPLTEGVPGIFTKDGHAVFSERRDRAVTELTTDSWILGRRDEVSGDAQASALNNRIDNRYFADYIRAWDQFLADLTVRPLPSMNEGARLLGILSGPDSPLRLVLQGVAKETTFADPVASAEKSGVSATLAANSRVQDKINSLKNRLAGVIGTQAQSPAGPAKAAEQKHRVDKHFERLHRLVKPAGEGAPIPLDRQLALLGEVSTFLDAAFSAKRQGAPAPPPDAVTRLKRDAKGQPSPVGEVMEEVANAGAALTMGSERTRLNSLWRASAGQFCEQAVRGRYPMTRNAQREVTHDDFGRLFAPGALIDDFFQKNLAAFVDMSRRRWRWRPRGEASLGISSAVLSQFQRAARIRDTFFAPGARTAMVRFELKPVSMDPAITQLRLDVDGQVLTYAHGPSRAVAFQWPKASGSSVVRAEFKPPSADGSTSVSAEGPWALFRLLDQSQVAPTSQRERFQVTFSQRSRRAQFELRAASVANPFDRSLLEKFRCPSRL